MTTAQKLYEAGYITYMRTDSVNLSEEALNAIKEYVLETYGEDYYQYTQYKSKSKNTQEAHEAIRPTYPSNTPESLN
jgi:DNA topoisomerase-1